MSHLLRRCRCLSESERPAEQYLYEDYIIHLYTNEPLSSICDEKGRTELLLHYVDYMN